MYSECIVSTMVIYIMSKDENICVLLLVKISFREEISRELVSFFIWQIAREAEENYTERFRGYNTEMSWVRIPHLPQKN